VVSYFGSKAMPVRLSRSRPFQKNDNRFVEQKNNTLVRAFFGSWRIDTRAQCSELNDLYDQMWLYYNFFQPVQHLVAKEMIDGKLRRIWDEPKTPFDRLLATGTLDQEEAHRFEELRHRTNPRSLRRLIRDWSATIWETVADTTEQVA